MQTKVTPFQMRYRFPTLRLPRGEPLEFVGAVTS